jgi:endonuclease/exonuclease/phosphatase family metal-dependent hydrolase
VLAATLSCTSPSRPAPGGATVTVMTRNLYLGADIDRPVVATARTGGGLDTLLAFAAANAELRAVVDRTDFPARSAALAREIVTAAPALVGLQEAALWRSGPLELPPPLGGSAAIGGPNATQVDIDFLAILLDRLRALGAPYEAVSVQQESDVEGPAFVGLAGIGTGRDIRLTMRDVVLRRVDSDVQVEHVASGQFRARVPFDVGSLHYAFVRGWNAVDVRVGGTRLRFVNTQLESEHRAPTVAQAQELVAGPLAAADRPVVLVCDCNTDPADSSPATLPDGSPDATKDAAYSVLTGPGGLRDAWLQTGSEQPGGTAGLSETLRDPPEQARAEFLRRIDLVLTRGPDRAVPVERAVVVGRDPAERTPSGLWPSDHAGVVVTLRP